MCKKCNSHKKHCSRNCNRQCNNNNNMNAANYANMPFYGNCGGCRGFGGGFGSNNLWPFLLFPFFF